VGISVRSDSYRPRGIRFLAEVAAVVVPSLVVSPIADEGPPELKSAV
jgi:hypothetical protein